MKFIKNEMVKGFVNTVPQLVGCIVRDDVGSAMEIVKYIGVGDEGFGLTRAGSDRAALPQVFILGVNF